MPDVFTQLKRSQVMGLIRGSGNASTELRLIKLMQVAEITGWRRGSKLPGRPDFIFPKRRLAVFVDGDFWHGHPVRSQIPATNRPFWEAKIKGNMRRDRKVTQALKLQGWTVLRIWEHSLKQHPGLSVARLQRALKLAASNLKAQAR